MKIGILGDLHFRSSTPLNRIDNYYEKQFNKLAQAFETFKQQDCRFVIQPGDFFHNYGKDPYNITYDVVSFLILQKIPIYLVFGQHDIKFHNTELTDIPIQILNKTNLITKLETKPTKIDNTILYGVNWNDSWPEKIDRSKKKTKILIMHQMVIKNKKLFPNQKDYIKAKNLHSNNQFDLIVSGDNHEAFSYGNKVINCGSLMRMRSDQKEHQPIYAIYDTEEKNLEVFEYQIDPSNAVLTEDTNSKEKTEENEKTEIFARSLDGSEFEGELNYRKNVNRTIKKKRCRKRTKQIIEESLNFGG